MFKFIAGLSVLISTFAFAGKPVCELALEHQDKVCAKTFRAQSIEDINSYLIDFKQKDGVPKNLKIDFDIAGSSLSIATPCRVILTDSKKIEVSGDVCINGQAGVIIRPYSTLSFRDMSLVSKNRVVIRNNSTINGSDLHLISSGDDEFSRSHIRHSSNINLSNLSVSGHARATLGHSSTYNVSGVVNLNSVSEFSAIWRDTNISAQSISINSDARIRLAKNLELNSSNIVLESNECSLSNNVLEGLGTCLTASFPIARLKKVESDIAIGSVINFDASRSVGAANFIFLIDGNIVQEGSSALFSYQFNQAGVHKIEVIAISSEGLRHRRSRKINVYIPFDNSPKANFVFVIGKGDLPEVFLSFSGSVGKDRSIKSIKYFVDGVQFVPEDFFYFTFVRADLERSGIKEISMELVDDLDQKSVKSYQVDANPGQMNYIANLDVYQSAPKTVFVDASQSFVGNEELFDYFQNEIPVLIDFGDGNSSEALLPKAFSSHVYESAGSYNISAQMKSTNPDIESMIVSQNINITEDPTPILEPVARFNYLLNDFDKSYSFFVERSASAYGEIINYLWKVNGVIVASGSEVELILEPNIYEISLEVVDELGNMGSFSRVINVNGDGSLFDLKLNCTPEEDNYLEYRCDLAFLDELKSVTSLNLDWGDGNSSNIAISNQTYQQSSLYHTYENDLSELEVLATLNRENSDSIQRSQTLFEGNAPIDPVAVLNCSFDVNILNCDGSQSVAGPSQYIVNYWFNIGGDGISPNISVEYPMGSSESVYVQLWVVDNQGRVGYAEGYFTQDITKPIANFDCTALGAELNCSDSSINSNGVITNRLWFVNGQLASEGVDKTSFSFTANYPAEYYISLVVVNSLDQSDDLTKSYFLNVPVYPVADFSCNVVENTINCDGSSSSTPYGEITSYRWLVNGNEHSTASSMSYTHESGGSVSIGLEVANNFNFYNSKYEAFDLNFPPSVAINCEQSLLSRIKCSSNAFDNDGDQLSYLWEVEGNNYTTQDLDIRTLSSGEILVKLTVSDVVSNVSVSENVNVLYNNPPQFEIGCLKTTKKIDCIAEPSEQNSNDDQIVSYQAFIDGESVSNENGFFSKEIDFSENSLVKVIATDEAGVITEKEENVAIYNEEVVIGLEYISKFLPAAIKVAHVNKNDFEVATYKWINEETNEESLDEIPTFTYLSSGSKSIRLEFSDIYGQSFSKVIEFEVYPDEPLIEAEDELVFVNGFLDQVSINIENIKEEIVDIRFSPNLSSVSIDVLGNVSIDTTSQSESSQVLTLEIETQNNLITKDFNFQFFDPVKVGEITPVEGEIYTIDNYEGLNGVSLEFKNDSTELAEVFVADYPNGKGKKILVKSSENVEYIVKANDQTLFSYIEEDSFSLSPNAEGVFTSINIRKSSKAREVSYSLNQSASSGSMFISYINSVSSVLREKLHSIREKGIEIEYRYLSATDSFSYFFNNFRIRRQLEDLLEVIPSVDFSKIPKIIELSKSNGKAYGWVDFDQPKVIKINYQKLTNFFDREFGKVKLKSTLRHESHHIKSLDYILKQNNNNMPDVFKDSLFYRFILEASAEKYNVFNDGDFDINVRHFYSGYEEVSFTNLFRSISTGEYKNFEDLNKIYSDKFYYSLPVVIDSFSENYFYDCYAELGYLDKGVLRSNNFYNIVSECYRAMEGMEIKESNIRVAKNFHDIYFDLLLPHRENNSFEPLSTKIAKSSGFTKEMQKGLSIEYRPQIAPIGGGFDSDSGENSITLKTNETKAFIINREDLALLTTPRMIASHIEYENPTNDPFIEEQMSNIVVSYKVTNSSANFYKNLYLGNYSTKKIVGNDMDILSFENTEQVAVFVTYVGVGEVSFNMNFYRPVQIIKKIKTRFEAQYVGVKTQYPTHGGIFEIVFDYKKSSPIIYTKNESGQELIEDFATHSSFKGPSHPAILPRNYAPIQVVRNVPIGDEEEITYWAISFEQGFDFTGIDIGPSAIALTFPVIETPCDGENSNPTSMIFGFEIEEDSITEYFYNKGQIKLENVVALRFNDEYPQDNLFAQHHCAYYQNANCSVFSLTRDLEGQSFLLFQLESEYQALGSTYGDYNYIKDRCLYYPSDNL